MLRYSVPARIVLISHDHACSLLILFLALISAWTTTVAISMAAPPVGVPAAVTYSRNSDVAVTVVVVLGTLVQIVQVVVVLEK